MTSSHLSLDYIAVRMRASNVLLNLSTTPLHAKDYWSYAKDFLEILPFAYDQFGHNHMTIWLCAFEQKGHIHMTF